jgi:hypothetical protein
MAPQGKYRTADEAPKAFVAEADSLGHWVTEADYRAAGYLPEFDELWVRIHSKDSDRLPYSPGDRSRDANSSGKDICPKDLKARSDPLT